mmetsp:Transcript_5414/g.13628  ORF Transcript_5414/g.13628 Transcript_5414/m.13628 type:complete len:105 (-) Transcript_5414:137-451(-)
MGISKVQDGSFADGSSGRGGAAASTVGPAFTAGAADAGAATTSGAAIATPPANVRREITGAVRRSAWQAGSSSATRSIDCIAQSECLSLRGSGGVSQQWACREP